MTMGTTKTTTAIQSLNKLQRALTAKFPSDKVEEIPYFFNLLTTEARRERWDSCLGYSGKFAEAVFKYFHYLNVSVEVDSIDVDEEVRSLEQNINLNSSERLTIPHTLRLIYEFAERRGGIHNSSFDPIKTDCVLIVALSKWVIEELARLYLTNDALAARLLVESLLVRDIPLIEELDGDRLVLIPGLSARIQLELLLYHEHPKRCTFKDLTHWIHNQSVENVRITLRNMRLNSLVHEAEDGWKLTNSGVDEAEKEFATLESTNVKVNVVRKSRKKGASRGRK